MNIRYVLNLALVLTLFTPVTTLNALPVSNTDLWQNSAITSFSSQHNAGPMTGFFDGQEGAFGSESGNALFADGMPAGTVHNIEWITTTSITLKSINLIAYHDFDGRDIRDRGFGEFRLYSGDGSDWNEIFSWIYNDRLGDLHYGGGESYLFNPDLHDMTRSYLELTENLSATVTSQHFRAEFTQYGSGGPRIVELDAYSTLHAIPQPSILLLMLSGVGLLILFKQGGVVNKF